MGSRVFPECLQHHTDQQPCRLWPGTQCKLCHKRARLCSCLVYAHRKVACCSALSTAALKTLNRLEGPALGVSVASVTEHFQPYGRHHVDVPDSCKSFLFVTFESVENATAAKQQLQGRCLCERALALSFAKLSHKYRSRVKSLYRAVWFLLSNCGYSKPGAAQCKEVGDMASEAVHTAAETTDIPGLCLLLDFVTDREEAALLAAVEEQTWHNLAKRDVCHFGYAFDYVVCSETRSLQEARTVDPSRIGSLPPFCTDTVRRIESLSAVGKIDQLTVNRYTPGVGLSPHVDVHSAFDEPIASLSLGSHVVMEFRRGAHKRPLLLPRRSLLLMTGESRYGWAHYIPHRKADSVNGAAIARGTRTSLTFRRVRGRECNCIYPEECDSQASTVPLTRASAEFEAGLCNDDSIATGDKALRMLEEEYVHRVYNAIAPHFSATRFAIWPEVKRFIDDLPSGAIVADVGCGNGKYFAVRPDVAVLGSDRSAGLVDTAMRRVRNVQAQREAVAADVLLADGMSLPYRSASVDAVLCVAVLHHISSPQRRLRFMRALLALLRPGGRAIVTVWSTEQEDPKRTLCRWTAIAMPGGAEGVGTQHGPERTGNGQYDPSSTTAAEDCVRQVTDEMHTELPNSSAAATRGNVTAGQSSGEPCSSGRSPTAQPLKAMQTEAAQLHDGSDAGSSANYFVPWHLPFHRAGLAHRPSASTSSCGKSDAGACDAAQGCNGRTSLAVAQPAVGEVDEEKKTVVFKRYYHLFAEGELQQLVSRMSGARLCYAKYDASNWVVVFERCTDDTER